MDGKPQHHAIKTAPGARSQGLIAGANVVNAAQQVPRVSGEYTLTFREAQMPPEMVSSLVLLEGLPGFDRATP